MLLIIFVEFRVVAGRSRTRAAVLCRGLEKNGMVSMAWARHVKCESDTHIPSQDKQAAFGCSL
jgi:hypothetical protein